MRGPQVFCLPAELNPALDPKAVASLTIDPASVTAIRSDARVKSRNGQVCTVRAWGPGVSLDKPPDMVLTMADFPEESGVETFFNLASSKAAVGDELLSEGE